MDSTSDHSKPIPVPGDLNCPLRDPPGLAD